MLMGDGRLYGPRDALRSPPPQMNRLAGHAAAAARASLRLARRVVRRLVRAALRCT